MTLPANGAPVPWIDDRHGRGGEVADAKPLVRDRRLHRRRRGAPQAFVDRKEEGLAPAVVAGQSHWATKLESELTIAIDLLGQAAKVIEEVVGVQLFMAEVIPGAAANRLAPESVTAEIVAPALRPYSAE